MTVISEISFLRHHVTHPAGFEWRQFTLVERCLVARDDLILGAPCQHHLCSLQSSRQHGSRSRRIETDRSANFGVPKFLSVGRRHPPSLDNTYKTILAFDGSFVAMASQDQNLGLAGYGFWRSASSQRNFGISVCHEVLIEWRHDRIGCLGRLCLPLLHCNEPQNQSET